jgi:CheY-like chemotaxis protein
VDDIDTNLIVLKGLLAPYQMKITLCTSGAEAIELIKKHRFDFVLMDHMMPEMDGIEATAAIREWEKEQRKNAVEFPKGVPIIALTANAISGMKEMFLEKGFDDYLSKPIEIAKLEGIIARWIPDEKRVNTGGEIKRESFSGDGGLSIPGVDTARGINMTGGTLDGYRQVLAAFYKDILDRLPHLASVPAETELAAFTIHVHALKGASAIIGAVGLSKEAAALEAAGRAGGIDMIRESLPLFLEHLQETAEGIRIVLDQSIRKPIEANAKQ